MEFRCWDCESGSRPEGDGFVICLETYKGADDHFSTVFYPCCRSHCRETSEVPNHYQPEAVEEWYKWEHHSPTEANVVMFLLEGRADGNIHGRDD